MASKSYDLRKASLENFSDGVIPILLVGVYFFKAVTFRMLHHYAIFNSGLYETANTKKELRKMAIISWLKGPIVEVIAFFLIFIDYRLALGVIFVVTLTNINPLKKR